ncbi:calcium-dependent lipid-binding (CaLB domain) family protein [Artemisia annua]|uniref:Calcium-dependent lipid-binding (CaLB domain) family protein n=1 Tax=Artemisia annua TaxID=35608 RepID=A0A2U1LCF2_ARTAN|nr:calcium-dependent lipid-binding (CaLB domain) family protein [Artemisia annua]
MEGVLGLLKLRVKRGINLAVRDTKTSDPYLVASLDSQKTKTKVIKGNCNPVWNDELTLTMKDPKAPIHIAVYDKDKFSNDDSMGMAEIDVKPYIECLRMGLNYNNLPNGTKLERVHPKKNNYLADQSCIVWENGKIVQDMVLRLRDVECGEVVIQIELVPLPGRKLHV